MLAVFDWLFAKQTPLGANDDWRTNANAANILEAALLVRLEPGAYTTVVSGVETSEVGIALVEVYEVGHEYPRRVATSKEPRVGFYRARLFRVPARD